MATSFLRWRFVDPHDNTGGGEYLFPLNPNQMTSPHPRRNITSRSTTAINGRTILIEGQSAPTEWTFSGDIVESSHYEQLRAWVYDRSGRRVYLYDHFGRRLTVVLTQFSATPKRVVGKYWRHTYEVSALVLEITAPTFQVAMPGAPTDVVATGGIVQATITWKPPATPGGARLSGYTVTDVTTGEVRTVAYGEPLTETFKNLRRGDHQFSVAATTPAGTGPAALAKATVAPADSPAPPPIRNFTINRDTATITWGTPSFDGGVPIREYIVECVTYGPWIEGTGTWILGPDVFTYTFRGLRPGTTYDFFVYSANTSSLGSTSSKRTATTLR